MNAASQRSERKRYPTDARTRRLLRLPRILNIKYLDDYYGVYNSLTHNPRILLPSVTPQ